jgi:phosphoglucosamine mutase
MKLFGTSGIRRIYDKDLLRLALNVGLAAGNLYGRAIVGRDTRTSGGVMKNALLAGLASGGARCYDADIVPTPTLAYSARDFDAAGMITASHNPPEYNGIKLIKPDGSAFDPAEETQIEQMIKDGALCSTAWDKIEPVEIYKEAVERHIQGIMSRLPGNAGTRVVLDCGSAAASVISPQLLERMGCKVVCLDCTPSGFFPRVMEPVEANLQKLIKTTKESGVDAGIAHDGDADRMMAVDDKGRFISGDKLLVIFAQALKAQKVVTTIDASMVIEEMGFDVVRTRIGDPAVSVALREGGDFGGEPSGSWMFPEISLCPDGIYAAALIAVIAGQQKLSELADNIPSYPVIRGSTSSQGIDIEELTKRLEDLKPLAISDIDGIRLEFGDGWMLVRPSGTEPKIRVTAEARDEKFVHQLYDNGINAIKKSIGE